MVFFQAHILVFQLSRVSRSVTNDNQGREADPNALFLNIKQNKEQNLLPTF